MRLDRQGDKVKHRRPLDCGGMTPLFPARPVASLNPNRIPSLSPALRRRSYAGKLARRFVGAESIASNHNHARRDGWEPMQPFQKSLQKFLNGDGG